ncbi:HAD hydrolase family protein [Staphylococcus xylosus]|uniref:HAD hydrolase family protein n=1 Tax=Staphylococcus xylosus TaxID=1288 RepID=A0A939SK17_STAXY|nr:HAD hydrolase family protein [Staphylococcus xylosus]
MANGVSKEMPSLNVKKCKLIYQVIAFGDSANDISMLKGCWTCCSNLLMMM